MTSIRTAAQALGLAFSAALLAACAGQTTVPSNLGIGNAPAWVNQGAQALDTDGGRLLHGIASAPALKDRSLQRSTADDRARAKLARTLSSFLHVASQDYAAAAGTTAQQTEQASITRNIQTFTRQNVSGARIIAHWRNPDNGILWSLAELNLNQVKQTVAASDDMNAGFKAYFNTHAANLFDAVTEEGVR